MQGFGFESLIAWQKARRLANAVYASTKQFPRSELFGLVSQMRRCAVSIPANVAEGMSRSSKQDQARFVEISYGSRGELVTMLYLSRDQGFLPEKDFRSLYAACVEVYRLLSGLRGSLVGKRETDASESRRTPDCKL